MSKHTMDTATRETVKSVLAGGGVITYPTEAVWGLGCNPWDQGAVQRILLIKRRPEQKGLILVAASQEQLAPLLEPLTEDQRRLLNQTWPGPVTWLIPDPNNWVPRWVRGQHTSVAVRVSAHPVVQELCHAWGKPLVSTSANRAGEPAHTTLMGVDAELGSEVDMVIKGETGPQASPSQIRDLLSGQVLRA